VLRKQVYDASGAPVSDEPEFQGLHLYEWRGMGEESCVAYDEDGTCIDTEDLSTVTYGPTQTSLPSYTDASGSNCAFGPAVGGVCPPASSDVQLAAAAASSSPTAAATAAGYPSGSMVAPSQSSSSWANFATALAKSGMTLAEINSIQPGTVVGANGSILRQATGLPVPVGSGVTAALGSGSSSMLLLIGAALVAVFALKGK
jgi:hypothetical protein